MNPDKGKRKRSQSPEEGFRRPRRRHAASHPSARMDLGYLCGRQQASGSTTTAPPMVEWRAHPTWGPSTSRRHPPETDGKDMKVLRRKYARDRDQEGALATDTEAGRIERPRWNFSYAVRGVATPRTNNEGSTQGWNQIKTFGSGSAVGADQIANNPDGSVVPSQARTPSLILIVVLGVAFVLVVWGHGIDILIDIRSLVLFWIEFEGSNALDGLTDIGPRDVVLVVVVAAAAAAA
ncbi:hypothetical protein BJ912DRAFT_927239, partial [Pholiota molesta]